MVHTIFVVSCMKINSRTWTEDCWNIVTSLENVWLASPCFQPLCKANRLLIEFSAIKQISTFYKIQLQWLKKMSDFGKLFCTKWKKLIHMRQQRGKKGQEMMGILLKVNATDKNNTNNTITNTNNNNRIPSETPSFHTIWNQVVIGELSERNQDFNFCLRSLVTLCLPSETNIFILSFKSFCKSVRWIKHCVLDKSCATCFNADVLALKLKGKKKKMSQLSAAPWMSSRTDSLSVTVGFSHRLQVWLFETAINTFPFRCCWTATPWPFVRSTSCWALSDNTHYVRSWSRGCVIAIM